MLRSKHVDDVDNDDYDQDDDDYDADNTFVQKNRTQTTATNNVLKMCESSNSLNLNLFKQNDGMQHQAILVGGNFVEHNDDARQQASRRNSNFGN